MKHHLKKKKTTTSFTFDEDGEKGNTSSSRMENHKFSRHSIEFYYALQININIQAREVIYQMGSSNL